jgi:peptide/nickel transport system ATP-binding protein
MIQKEISSRANYLSARQSHNIAQAQPPHHVRELEKRNNRKNVPESEYLAEMKRPGNVVEFDDLHTYFFTDAGTVKAVDGVTFDVPLGKTVGVVGESGCGKSVTSLSLMQIVQRPQGQIVSGAIRFDTGKKGL